MATKIIELKSGDGKVHVSTIKEHVFVWWSYTDDNRSGHIILLDRLKLDTILELLGDPTIFYCQLYHNGSANDPMELWISGDNVSFRTDDKRLPGSLGRTEFSEFLTAVQASDSKSKPQSM